MCEFTPTSRRALTGGGRSAAEARRFVEASLCAEHPPGSADDAVLLASELVTWSLLTGAWPTAVAVDCQAGELEISVTTAPVRPEPVTDLVGARVYLIDLLATRWWVDDDGPGSVLRCTLPVAVPAGVRR